MSTIQFKEANCKNCYKCIRSCPVKAISFMNDQAQIIEDRCVLCGKCLQACPQNAKSVESELDKVKGFTEKKLKIYGSIAPSFAPAFNIKNKEQMEGVFKKLGFTYIEETAVGAEKVSEEYHKLMMKREMKNIITTACPTINSLVEKYYPELIEYLAPVVSPMIAHGKMLKEMYGSRIKVVFVGPCISKKEDFMDSQNDDVIDGVLTFEEFEVWLKEEGLSFNDETCVKSHGKSKLNSRFYPAPGGIIKTLALPKNYKYKLLKFDGIDPCVDILNQLKNESISGYFFEMNSCAGGCLGGPCMNSESGSFLEMREKLLHFAINESRDSNASIDYDTRIKMGKRFKDKSNPYVIPYDDIIGTILNKIGKFSKEDELDCGACGYNSCREKAIAVYNNKADINMCLPFMRERAESISNIIINNTHNAIIAINEDFTIQEINLATSNLLKYSPEEIVGKNILEVLDCPDINTIREDKKDIINKKYYYEKYKITVEQSMLYVKQYHIIVVVMKDITTEEKEEKRLDIIRAETVDIAQRVIDKQMRVAQEIASLLGETTAETKVVLTKLKKSVQEKIGEE